MLQQSEVLLVSFLYYKMFSFHSTLTFKREFNRKTLENIVYNTQASKLKLKYTTSHNFNVM